MCACMKCVGVWVSGDVVANSISVYPLHFASVSEGLGWGGVGVGCVFQCVLVVAVVWVGGGGGWGAFSISVYSSLIASVSGWGGVGFRAAGEKHGPFFKKALCSTGRQTIPTRLALQGTGRAAM